MATTARVIINRREDRCEFCRQTVPAGTGVAGTSRLLTSWIAAHLDRTPNLMDELVAFDDFVSALWHADWPAATAQITYLRGRLWMQADETFVPPAAREVAVPRLVGTRAWIADHRTVVVQTGDGQLWCTLMRGAAAAFAVVADRAAGQR